LPLRCGDKPYDFGLFADEHDNLEYALLKIPHLTGDKIPEELIPLIQVHSEHLLSVLRLTHGPEMNLHHQGLRFFVDDGTSFNTNIDVSQIIGDSSFDPDRTREVFEGTFGHGEEIRLLVDSHDYRIPLQYRYLSLYKVLELAFKTGNKWEETKLKSFLNPYQGSFEQLKIASKPLANYIHELRDRCAHIHTGSTGRRQLVGVTELNQREAAKVAKILPILTDICVAVINERGAGKFVITPRRPQEVVKYQGRIHRD
jgi:hypothetical protein